jgi:hypothetical protein
MVEEVKRETGFFWHLVRSTRKYVCDDPKVARQLQEKMDELHHRSETAKTLPSASNAATLGALLAGHVPCLRVADAALVAGTVVLFWEMGCDRFCSWSSQVIQSRL